MPGGEGCLTLLTFSLCLSFLLYYLYHHPKSREESGFVCDIVRTRIDDAGVDIT